MKRLSYFCVLSLLVLSPPGRSNANGMQASEFQVLGPVGGATRQFRLAWRGVPALASGSFRLEMAPSLNGPWEEVPEGMVTLNAGGAEGLLRIPALNLGTKAFFRAKATPLNPMKGDYVAIPASTFAMGDASANGQPEEQPVHNVALNAYKIGRREITWGEWQRVRAWAVANGYPQLSGTGDGKAADHPVHSVSWLDVTAWCNAKSQLEGLLPCYDLSTLACDFTKNGFRLPTEAEWECAARGGVAGNQFPNGNTLTQAQGNYHVLGSATANSFVPLDANATRSFIQSTTGGGVPFTSRVAVSLPNAWRLEDTAGNLSEWCQDFYAATFYAVSPSANPTGPGAGDTRVIRGGSWNGSAIDARVAARRPLPADVRLNFVGFRLVCRS
jgi:formylglycine-generating enzyme